MANSNNVSEVFTCVTKFKSQKQWQEFQLPGVESRFIGIHDQVNKESSAPQKYCAVYCTCTKWTQNTAHTSLLPYDNVITIY
jgi:hypothetical protein